MNTSAAFGVLILAVAIAPNLALALGALVLMGAVRLRSSRERTRLCSLPPIPRGGGG